MTTTELTKEYNSHAKSLGQPEVKKFRDKATALRRLASIKKQAENMANRKKEKTPAPGRPAKKGRKMRLVFAPQQISKIPREGTLSYTVLQACFNGIKFSALEKVVADWHKEKGNFDKLKCSTRYFTCKAIQNLAKLNGYGFRQSVSAGEIVIQAYESDYC